MTKAATVETHEAFAPAPASIRLALLTASDTRTAADDEAGRALRRAVEAGGFVVAETAVSTEEPAALRRWVEERLRGRPGADRVDAVIVTGGTGIAPRDRTPEAIAPMFERGLPGFGELYRMLSFAEIGPAAMLSRADAGVVAGGLVFLLPGSPSAVELAVRRLIAPVLPHALGQLRRAGHPGHGDDGHSPRAHDHHGR
jgi:molybdopterin adenylyltransferase